MKVKQAMMGAAITLSLSVAKKFIDVEFLSLYLLS
jgi:hypothetical protein